MQFPKKLEWKHCSCGHPSCHRIFPVNLGMFYQGSGFSPEEARELNRRWELGA